MTKYRTAVLVTVILAFFIVSVGLASRALADEVEEAVITEAFDSLWSSTNADSWDADTFDAHMADFAELWSDLPIGTYCETYASMGFVLSLAADTIAEEDETMAPVVPAALYLINEIDSAQAACLQEGV